MSDVKSARLINLTMALLGKKYVTKSAIFERVEGYSGSPETMERMFERDKTDLRELGIEIDVGAFDPLFEDEPGYRILNSGYTFDLGELTSEEVALLALASQAWSESTQSQIARSAIRKIKSLSTVSAEGEIAGTLPHLNLQADIFNDLWQAINNGQEIIFTYLSVNSQSESLRKVQPYGLCSWQSAWYLAGRESRLNEIKVFKLSRVIGEIEVCKPRGVFSVPADFKISEVLVMANPMNEPVSILRVEKGTCQKLRAMASKISELEDYDELEISERSKYELIPAILWHGSDVEIISPPEIRSEVMRLLTELSV